MKKNSKHFIVSNITLHTKCGHVPAPYRSSHSVCNTSSPGACQQLPSIVTHSMRHICPAKLLSHIWTTKPWKITFTKTDRQTVRSLRPYWFVQLPLCPDIRLSGSLPPLPPRLEQSGTVPGSCKIQAWLDTSETIIFLFVQYQPSCQWD